MKSKSIIAIIVSLLLVIGLCIYPLMTNKESEFGGTDDSANDIIAEIDPTYEAWANPKWEPPGSETESLLFCLQAAIGSGVLCFGFGYLYGNKKSKKVKEGK